MKKINIHYLFFFVTSVLLLSGCSKDFLEKAPTDSITDGNFYKSDDEVLAGTALLYSKVWFDYNDKASFNLGDFRAGTAYSAYNYRGNVLFNTTADNTENSSAWSAFFNVVGQANMAIVNINKYAGSGVSAKIKRHALAEARFMRALAYRYLVMNWGDVPIITNNQAELYDTTLQRNTVKSVWKFITYEMRSVANDLDETPDKVGRISKWSAEGMLARFYLTRAGVESVNGVRNQIFLDSAKYYANDVIKSNAYSLLSSYENLFKYPYDNNSESLFELEWVFNKGEWGSNNSVPSYIAYSNDIGNDDGWGGSMGATWWMLKMYDGINTYGNATLDTTLIGRTSDTRLKATYMLPGAYYPEITQTLNGVDQKLIFPSSINAGVSYASIKKYVIGQAKDVGGNCSKQYYPNDTYMMRLAEIYLIYAEAALGNNTSTTDGTALEYFNKVHTRAGLPEFTDPLTPDVIFKERIKEFAMEGMAWYDLVSMHYYNPEKVYSILNSQDRGLFAVIPDQFPNPTQWTFRKTSWATNASGNQRTINAYDGNFLLPIPAVESSQAPNLRKPAVDYYAK